MIPNYNSAKVIVCSATCSVYQQQKTKTKSKIHITVFLWWESTGDRWSPMAKDQLCDSVSISWCCYGAIGWMNHMYAYIYMQSKVCRRKQIKHVNVLYVQHQHLHHNDIIMSAMASQITSLTIVYSIAYLGADQRKHQRSASLAFVGGMHRWPVNSVHKGPVTRKSFPFDDVIMYHNLWGSHC